jgi:hypothetical protein
MKILDASGRGYGAKVDSSNRLHTAAVTESQNGHAIEDGNSYNISTGLITISGNATLIYFKNNENRDFFVEAIAIGSFEGITHSADPYITVVRNPTGGDLITDATAVSINVNRNFASSNTLTANAYKGKTGGTLTGGADFGIFQINPATRNFLEVNLLLPKGSSVGITLAANLSSGSASWYAAIVGFLKDEDLST